MLGVPSEFPAGVDVSVESGFVELGDGSGGANAEESSDGAVGAPPGNGMTAPPLASAAPEPPHAMSHRLAQSAVQRRALRMR